MNYSIVSSNLNSSVGKINDSKMLIKNIDFDSNWSGSAHDTLVVSLEKVLKELDTVKTDLSTFSGALSLLDVYIAKLGQIEKLQLQLDGLDPEDSRDRVLYDSITSKINTLRTEIKELEDAINAILSSFGVFSGQYSIVNDISWDELVELVNTYNKLPVVNNGRGSGNLFKNLTITDEDGNVIRDGKEYFINTIKSIRKQYSGTEQNYYVTLGMINMCVEAGVRPEYWHHGTGFVSSDSTPIGVSRAPVPYTAVDEGFDCNAAVSFIIFGDDSETKWLEVGTYDWAGEHVPYEETKRGCIFANGDHVGMVMGYNPETDQYILWHARGEKLDTQMNIWNKNYLIQHGYKIRNVDDTYIAPYHDYVNE